MLPQGSGLEGRPRERPTAARRSRGISIECTLEGTGRKTHP